MTNDNFDDGGFDGGDFDGHITLEGEPAQDALERDLTDVVEEHFHGRAANIAARSSHLRFTRFLNFRRDHNDYRTEINMVVDVASRIHGRCGFIDVVGYLIMEELQYEDTDLQVIKRLKTLRGCGEIVSRWIMYEQGKPEMFTLKKAGTARDLAAYLNVVDPKGFEEKLLKHPDLNKLFLVSPVKVSHRLRG
jgi:hypothetical protein